jgi:hypothetical protein
MPKFMAVIDAVIALIKWFAARLATGNEVKVNRLILGEVISPRRFIGRRANWVNFPSLLFVPCVTKVVTILAIREMTAVAVAAMKIDQRLF